MKNNITINIAILTILSGCASVNSSSRVEFVPLNNINESNSITCVTKHVNSTNKTVEDMHKKYVSKYYLTTTKEKRIQVTMVLFGEKHMIGLFNYYEFFGTGNDFDHDDYKDLYSNNTSLTLFRKNNLIIIDKDKGAEYEVRISAECSKNIAIQ